MQTPDEVHLGVSGERLAGVLEKRDHILSAILLPRFKLDWVQDEEKRFQYRMMLKREFQTFLTDDTTATTSTVVSAPSCPDKKDPAGSFFRFSTSPSVVPKSEVDLYLDAPATQGFDEYMQLPKLRRLFIKHNTALPSSAPVERLFSAGGLIFR